jgi:hypothetical protein
MKSIDELKERLSIWHVKYCKLIESKISAPYGGYRTYPDAELFLGKPQQRLRGQYIRYKHLCRYSICHALTDNDFESTVAHEVCHSYQMQLYPASTWHGEFFYFLMREICGFKAAGRLHKSTRADMQKVQNLYALLSLSPERKKLQHVQISLQSVGSESKSAAEICARKD